MISAEEVHKTQNSEGEEKKKVLCVYSRCFQTSVELLVAPADLSVNSERRHTE